MVGRSSRKAADPDLGVLSVRLLFGLQSELFHRSAEEGFDDLRPRHGAVTAYLDEDGLRQIELTRLTGRNKQTVATIVDELEELGYVTRVPDPADRRAKVIVPTERGRRLMRVSDQIVADLEREYAEAVGEKAYEQFVSTLKSLVDHQSSTRARNAGATT
jgi:DNA-binding MarR family transcriptional regulator